MNTETAPLLLEEETFEKLAILAARNGRSCPQEMAFILKLFVAQFEAENGPIK